MNKTASKSVTTTVHIDLSEQEVERIVIDAIRGRNKGEASARWRISQDLVDVLVITFTDTQER